MKFRESRPDKDKSFRKPLPTKRQQNNMRSITQSDTVSALHRVAGNQGVQRLLRRDDRRAELSVSSSRDKSEREAERVAEQVVHDEIPESVVNAHEKIPLEDTADDASVTSLASKHPSEPLGGGGQPLSRSERSFFEPRLRQDFGDVRVHTGPWAEKAAQAMDAQAFTIGRHLFFGNGKYISTTDEGKKLLAHELTHVVQQTIPGRSKGRQIIHQSDSTVVHRQRTRAGAARRQVDRELLFARIAQMRTENLMILYVDSFDGETQRNFYSPRPWIGVSRRALTPQFLNQRATRLLLQREFRGAVDWLSTQTPGRWETLYWLHTTFPQRYLQDAPQEPLNEMREYIEQRARTTRAGSVFRFPMRTGWDEIQAMRGRRQEHAATEQAQRRDEENILEDAVSTLRRGLRQTAGMDLHRIIFQTSYTKTLGGVAHSEPINWANALVRYVQTINELRQGRPPSAGGLLPGAPRPATARMVTGATDTWRTQLTESQRRLLAADNYWYRAVHNIWPEVVKLIRWGLDEAEVDIRPEVLGGGRYMRPTSSVIDNPD